MSIYTGVPTSYTSYGLGVTCYPSGECVGHSPKDEAITGALWHAAEINRCDLLLFSKPLTAFDSERRAHADANCSKHGVRALRPLLEGLLLLDALNEHETVSLPMPMVVDGQFRNCNLPPDVVSQAVAVREIEKALCKVLAEAPDEALKYMTESLMFYAQEAPATETGGPTEAFIMYEHLRRLAPNRIPAIEPASATFTLAGHSSLAVASLGGEQTRTLAAPGS